MVYFRWMSAYILYDIKENSGAAIMKKSAAIILLIVDILMGLSLFFAGGNKPMAARDERKGHAVAETTGTQSVSDAVVTEESGNAGHNAQTQENGLKKIALTFDDEVIIGLSQEISYIRSRFYDLVLF